MALSLIIWGLCVVFGIAFTVNPLLMWHFTESWKAGSEAGPEEGYMRYARTFGVILAVIGVGMAVLTLVL